MPEVVSVDGLKKLYEAMGKADLTIPELLTLLEHCPKRLKALLCRVHDH